MGSDYTLGVKVTGDASSFNKTLSDVESKLGRVSSKLKTTGDSLVSVGKALAPVAIAFGALQGGAIKTTISFTKLYETTMIVFEKMLGGKEAASDLYDSLLDIAKASTFSQEPFLEAGKKLVGMGLSAEQTTKYMQAVSDSVSAFGGNTENIKNVTDAFAKISTAGKVNMEDVNRLSDNGVNALKILANQYGVTTSEMRDMISEGAVPAEEAMDKLAEGIENGTDGVNGMTVAMAGMAKSMKGKTLTGALDSVKTSIRSFSLSLTGINPTLKENDEGYEESKQRLEQLTAAISTTSQIIPLLSTVFGGVTDAIGSLLDKLVGVNATFNEATGEWENVEGILGDLKTKLEEMDPEKLQRIGDVIRGLALASPILFALGKALQFMSGMASTASTVVVPALGGIKTAILSLPQIPTAVVGGYETIALKSMYAADGVKAAGTAMGGAFAGLGTKLSGLGSSFLATAGAAGRFILPFLPIIAIIGAVAGIIAYLWNTNEEFKNSLIESGNEIKASFQPVMEALSDLFTQVAAAIQPAIEALVPVITELVTAFADVFAAVAPLIGTLISALVPAIVALVSAIAPIIEALAPVIIEIIGVITDLIIALMPIITMLVEIIAAVIIAIVQIITPIIQFIAEVITAIIKIITPIIVFIANVIAAIIGVITAIISKVTAIFTTVKNTILNAWDSISSGVASAINTIKNIIQTVKNTVSSVFNTVKSIVLGVFNAISNAWNGLTSIVDAVTSGISSAFDSVVNTFKGVINNVIGGINSAIGLINKIPGVEISTISYLYRGTDDWSGGFARMNEGGRGELTYLPNGTQVIPHDVSMKYAKESAKMNYQNNGGMNYDILGQKVAEAVFGLAEPIRQGMRDAVDGMGVSVDGREFGRLQRGVY